MLFDISPQAVAIRSILFNFIGKIRPSILQKIVIPKGIRVMNICIDIRILKGIRSHARAVRLIQISEQIIFFHELATKKNYSILPYIQSKSPARLRYESLPHYSP